MTDEHQGERILVVDDAEPNLVLLRSLLSLEGYEVTTARSGQEALEAARSQPFDLVLLDVMMPEMSGYEVCKTLKSRPETMDVPVIFVTAKGEVDEKVAGLDVGADDYVSKPFHPDELRARMRAALRVKMARDRLRREREDLAAQAITDPLTGVFNRRHLSERLAEELLRSRRYGTDLTCLMIDLDHFKEVNDTYGHPTGDTVLKRFVDIMRSCIRASDILARYGGEEFTIVTTGTGLDGARATAEKLRRVTEANEFPTENGVIRLTASVGVAPMDPEDTPEMLLARSDRALYEAKRRGRNLVVVAEPSRTESPVEAFFGHLWADYARLAPGAARVREALEARGERVVNDHVAFRTYDVAPLNLESLERHLLALGYRRHEGYTFEEKRLRAFGYLHPEAPRVFLSELETRHFSPWLQETVRALAAQVDPARVERPDVLWAGRLWAPVPYADYQRLLAESEYAGWVAALGLRANHFTVSVNHLSTFASLEALLDFLEAEGFPLSTAGGRVKGTPEVLLEQASTLADRAEVEFAGGERHEIPTCYYEFARRYPDGSGALYQGFVAASADRIFESTDSGKR